MEQDGGCPLQEGFPEIPGMAAKLIASAQKFLCRWQEFTAKRGSSVSLFGQIPRLASYFFGKSVFSLANIMGVADHGTTGLKS